MALRVWLPLNGNTKNQGLLGDFIQSTTPNYTTNGKLGKAMTTGAFVMSAEQTASVLNNEAISFCFWVYIDADTGTTNSIAMFFGNDSMGANNNRKFSIYNYPTVNDLHLSWMNDAASTPFIAQIMSGVFPSRQWTHVAITYQNPTCKVYINGIQRYTYTGTSNSTSFAYQTQLIHNASYRRLNDFRIYDHCLSAKEVSEIGKGLVLHYPFNNSGFGMPNLIKGNFSCISTKDTYSSTGEVICTLSVADILANKGKTLTFSYRVNSPGSYTSSQTGWTANRFGLHGGFNYTNTAGSTIQAYPMADLLVVGKTEGLYSCSWTIPSDISSINSSLWFAVQTNPSDGFAKPASNNNETWYLKDIKLEWGSKPTTWIPNSADALYSDIGLNNAIEFDCSGLGNNGTRTGTLVCNVDSPRYTTSYKIGLTKAYVETPDIAFEQMSQGTLNIWINRHSSTSDWRTYVFFANSYNWTGNQSDFIIIGSTGSNSIVLDCCSNTYTYTPSLNEWHMYTITWDLQQHISNFYIDGRICQTITSTRIDTLYASKHSYHVFGNQVSSDVNDYSMSDARIYATALSADDIKQLYNSPISVDKSGNLFAAEFKEVENHNVQTTKPSFHKNGIINSNTYLEPDENIPMSIGKDYISANELIEF